MSTNGSHRPKLSVRLSSFILDAVIFGFIFCVIWILIAAPDDAEKLQLGRNSLIAVSLMLLGALAAELVSRLGMKTLGQITFEPAHMRAAEDHSKSWYQAFWGWELLIGFAVSCWVGARLTEFSIYELIDRNGLQGAGRIFSGLLHPEFAILPQAVLAIIDTIFIAFMATVIALPASFVLSFLCAKNIMAKRQSGYLIYASLRTFFNVVRSIEPLVWAIIFGVWVGIGPFAGMLALMLHSVASLVKQYSEIIEGVEDGPIEAIEATGAGPLQVIWFAVVPQIILPFVSFTIYRWDINVRMATIIGLVGGGGIGNMLIQYQGQSLWHEVGCLVLVIAVVVWLMDTASARIREAIK